MNLLKQCLAEFLGAFAIVFAGCGAILADRLTGGAVTHAGVAAACGLIVMVMVYATGHISGAHLNPAVTVAFAVGRHFPAGRIAPYVAAQCGSAVSASLLHVLTLGPVFARAGLTGPQDLGVTLPVDNTFMTALVWEAVLTFLLMFVIMAVATDTRAVGQLAGLAIGATVAVDALFGGPVSGASMNPARSLGPALVSGTWEHFPAYVLGPLAGAVLAALVYNFIRCERPGAGGAGGCC